MGCVCGKFSPPQVKRVASKEGSRTTRSSKRVGEGVKRETQTQRVSVSVNKDSTANDGGVVEGEKGKTVAKKGKTTKDLDVKEEKMAEYGFVDGWPKWLLDNIPANVLAKIVPKSADSFEKLAKIGRGTYSNVYKAREKGTGKIVALKKVRFDTSDSESIKFMAREIMILQMLDHPNVIKLKGLATSRMQYSLYLVFDFMQSDLTRIISRPGEKLTEAQLTTSYRPPNHYKLSFEENFQNFPSSSQGLLATFLDLNPAHRGSAASALQSEFFKCSPLACDPSALPDIPKDEDERLQTKRGKRQRVSKRGQSSQTSRSDASQSEKVQITAEQPREDTESSKEKNMEQHKQGQETVHSASSTSSGSRLFMTEGSTNASMSPVFLSSGSVRKSPKIEGHPNALRNIENYSALLQQTSVLDMINRNEGKEFPQLLKSFSALDFRLDSDKLS
ncbi:hypothetical protein JHK87_015236 [Glycine soja]|nr:hypothetical protein JHK87_015236 [Glycine soja]